MPSQRPIKKPEPKAKRIEKKRERRFELSSYKRELTLLAVAIATLTTCEKKYEPVPGVQQTAQLAPPPPSKKSIPIDPVKQAILDGEIESLVSHVNAEMAKPEAADLPVLVVFLEEHHDRDVLAKELGVSARLKKEQKINDSSTELTRDMKDDAIKIGVRSLSNLAQTNEAQNILDGKTNLRPKTPQAAIDLENKIKTSRERLQSSANSIYNMSILGQLLEHNGVQVKYRVRAVAENDPEYSNRGNLNFIHHLALTDQDLVSLLEQDVKPRTIACGELHARAVVEAARGKYNVILLSLSPTPSDPQLEKDAREADRKLAMGEPLNDAEITSKDVYDRLAYAKAHAFKAHRRIGIKTITEAIDMADASPGVTLHEPPGFAWREVDASHAAGKSR